MQWGSENDNESREANDNNAMEKRHKNIFTLPSFFRYIMNFSGTHEILSGKLSEEHNFTRTNFFTMLLTLILVQRF